MARKMKDSGIEWIGEIPEDWETVKLKHLVLDRQAGVWGKDENEDNLENNKVCIRIADFDYSRMSIRKDREFTLRNYTDNEIAKCSLRKGDILIEKSGGGEKTPVGRTIIWNEDFQALYANFIERLRVDENQIIPMFAQFCFFAFYGIGGSNLYFNQTTGIQNLDITGMMNDLRLPTANLSTQIKIVEIFDKKRKQIEKIKSTTLQEIQILEDYKKSVITEAVTKGLDKNVEMKDSGIEWIGEIPINSNIVRLKHLVSRNITDGTHQTPDYEDKEKGYPFLSSKDITKGYIDWSDIKYITKNLHKKLQSETKVERDDILLAKNGTTGIAAIVDTDKVFDIYVTLALIRPNTKLINPKFLLYSINSLNSKKQFSEHLVGIGVPNLHLNLIKNTFITVHNMGEQKRISDYLDYKCKTVDEIISLKQKQLETLEEYKKSLIYEYVTGKKEV